MLVMLKTLPLYADKFVVVKKFMDGLQKFLKL